MEEAHFSEKHSGELKKHEELFHETPLEEKQLQENQLQENQVQENQSQENQSHENQSQEGQLQENQLQEYVNDKETSPEGKKEVSVQTEDEATAGPSQQDDLSKPMQSSQSAKDDAGTIESIRRFMAEKLGFSEGKELKKKLQVLDEVSVAGIVKYIKSGKCKNIIVMAGAGISTSAGIPDFRTPGSGLYDNLAKYNLPFPEAMFEIHFFKRNPEPFYALAKELFPGSYKPTIAHYFVALLNQKNLLLRFYTQNIDGLEKLAGICEEKIVEAHGTFYTSHCLFCQKEYSLDWMKEKIFADKIPKCENCQGLIKPDIVFFGENLPNRFLQLVKKDFPKADLLIIMGSSLAVQPFASLVGKVSSSCPRLLMNREKAGQKELLLSSLLGLGGSLEYDSEKNYRDVAFLGDCDDLCQQFVDQLGWTEDLKKLMEEAS